jgi:hypothetical protein
VVGGRLLLALALLTAAATGVGAQEAAEVMRPCRRPDLLGLWAVIRFGLARDAPVNRDDPAYRAHQRFAFRPDATMAYRASATPLTLDDDRALRTATTDLIWALDPEGRLLRQQVGTPRVERSDCRVVTRPLRDPRSPVPTLPVPTLPGDLLLTDRTDDERPIARRLLRKLPTDD